MEEDKCKILEEFKESIKNYSSPEMIKLQEKLFNTNDVVYKTEKISILCDLYYKKFIHHCIHC